MPTIKIDHNLIRDEGYMRIVGDVAAAKIARFQIARSVADQLAHGGFVTEEIQGDRKVYSIRAIAMTMDEHEQHMTFKRELLERLAALEAVAKEVAEMHPYMESPEYLQSLKDRAILALKKGE